MRQLGRPRASQPIRRVETAPRLGKTHTGDHCFDFLTESAQHDFYNWNVRFST